MGSVFRAPTCGVDSCLAIHARGLRGVGIEGMPGNDSHTIEFPFWRMRGIMVLGFRHCWINRTAGAVNHLGMGFVAVILFHLFNLAQPP